MSIKQSWYNSQQVAALVVVDTRYNLQTPQYTVYDTQCCLCTYVKLTTYADCIGMSVSCCGSRGRVFALVGLLVFGTCASLLGKVVRILASTYLRHACTVPGIYRALYVMTYIVVLKLNCWHASRTAARGHMNDTNILGAVEWSRSKCGSIAVVIYAHGTFGWVTLCWKRVEQGGTDVLLANSSGCWLSLTKLD